jgi:hypothetical protein
MRNTPSQCRVCGADCPKSHVSSPRKFCSNKCYWASKKGQPSPCPPDILKLAQKKGVRRAAKKIRGTTQTKEHRDKRLNASWKSLASSPRACARCGGTFFRTSPSQIYCTGQCWLASHRKKYIRKKRFTIPAEEYQWLSEKQGNRCAICGVLSGTNGRNDRLNVDHCHKRNVCRGLLCHRCNTALGLFRDDVENLESAIRYLKEHAP